MSPSPLRISGPAPDLSDLGPANDTQEIVAELHCNKGIGKDHAKWSPVGE